MDTNAELQNQYLEGQKQLLEVLILEAERDGDIVGKLNFEAKLNAVLEKIVQGGSYGKTA